MLWELRRKALRLIPKWFVRLKVCMIRSELRKKGHERLLYSGDELRGRFVDEIIRDYLNNLLYGHEEIREIYDQLKKEKERIFLQNRGLIYKAMKYMRAGFDDREEVEGVARLALYQAIEDWDEVHALSTIAMPLMIARIQDYYEKQVKNFAYSYDELVREDDEEKNTFEIFLGEEDRNFEKYELKDLIDRLDGEEKKLIELVYFEGYNMKSAEEKLGLSHRQAGRIHRLALEKLRKLMLGKEVSHD